MLYKSIECHTGTKKLGENRWISLYGGGTSRGVSVAPPINIVLNLSGQSIIPENVVEFNELAKELFGEPYSIVIPEIAIDWPDYGIPPLSKDFWNWLIEKLESYYKKIGHVHLLCCCVGGHGRTGTALAILGSLLNIIPQDQDPLKFVRNNYCKRAIETEKQTQYIEIITGRKLYYTPRDTTYSLPFIDNEEKTGYNFRYKK